MGDTVRHSLFDFADPAPRFEFISSPVTHTGKGSKKINEDAYLDRTEIGLWAVADGVGGAAAGDRASSLVVEALQSVGPPVTATDFLSQVDDALRSVNTTIRGEASGQDRGMASTVVALLIFGAHFACAWAGDSRIYVMRQGLLRQLSRDHSEVQEMVDSGLLDPEDAARHPRSNVITRAVGAHESLDIDHFSGRVESDDTFLLCSDGLTKVLSDEEIAAILVAQPVESSADLLVQATLDRGAPDNVTVLVVKASAERPD